MKKIILFILVVVIMSTTTTTFAQNGIGCGVSVSHKKLTDSTILVTINATLTNSYPAKAPYDTMVHYGFISYCKLDYTIGAIQTEIIAYNNQNDTVRRYCIPAVVGYTKKYHTGIGAKKLKDFPYLGPDSVEMTGATITFTDTIIIPNPGVWTIKALMISAKSGFNHANFCLRDKKFTNIDSINLNPHPFIVSMTIDTNIFATQTNTMIGYDVFNSNSNNKSITYESDNWYYVENGKPFSLPLGISDLDGDSLDVRIVNTITSDISPIPLPITEAAKYTYLYQNTKVLPFVAGYNVNRPFNTIGTTFWLNHINQTVYFSTPLGSRQFALLSLKIDEYDHITGLWKGSSNRDIVIVTYDPITWPVGIQEIDNNQIIVYPNPANDWIGINNYSGPVEVFNILGQKVFGEKSSGKMNTSTWPNGLYLVKTGDHTTKVEVRH